MEKRLISEPTPYEMSPELDQQISAMIAEADRDAEEVRINMRWRKAQADLVKRAAARFGIPYQTYIKQVVFRQALADLDATAAVSGQGSVP
ncbi:MAG: hypothetical protein HY331_04030 [Chloroflexi bacterium]|nr:hypothetical protein [Chloroflexota bacterium]